MNPFAVIWRSTSEARTQFRRHVAKPDETERHRDYIDSNKQEGSVKFSAEFAERRFGYGLSPVIAPVTSLDTMLAGVTGPDMQSDRFPIEDFETFRGRMMVATAARKARKQAQKDGDAEAASRFTKECKVINREARQAKADWLLRTLLRRTYTEQAFYERLVAFWGDHFTAQGKAGVMRRGTSPYLETSIRPHVGGLFADLLIATVTSRLMLHYLDQERSMGPQSARAIKKAGQFGLNENLAREVIELHTLGVGGSYTQMDVRQLAELLTGLTYQIGKGTRFRKDFAEPGEEMILGNVYGPKPGMASIKKALRDLAAHPATARHIAHKLAVHFVSDTPDPVLVQHIEQAYLRSDGNLTACYAALLEHPAAWQRDTMNMRPALEFVSAAMRALAIKPEPLLRHGEKQVAALFYGPLTLMGQRFQQPNGPDGWPEGRRGLDHAPGHRRAAGMGDECAA